VGSAEDKKRGKVKRKREIPGKGKFFYLKRRGSKYGNTSSATSWEEKDQQTLTEIKERFGGYTRCNKRGQSCITGKNQSLL